MPGLVQEVGEAGLAVVAERHDAPGDADRARRPAARPRRRRPSRAWSGPAQWDTGKRVAERVDAARRGGRRASRGAGGPARSRGRAPRPRARPAARRTWSRLPRAREQERLDERVDVAVHHRVHVADLDVRPVVLDELVGCEHVRADLAAERDLLLVARQLLELRLPLLVGDLVEPRPEHAHRGVAVPELRALVLARHHDPRGQMGDAHRRVRRVDALAAGAGRAEDVDAELVVPDHDLDVLDLRHDRDRREGRVAALGGVEGRDPHEPVDAGLALAGSRRRTRR